MKLFSLTSIFSFSAILLLAGCASLPETLKSDSPRLISDYQAWSVQTTADGTPIRLGGVIAAVTNLDNKTRIEVVNLPISESGKPDIDKEPHGRFVGYIDGFIDPVTFAKGRMVTLLGTSQGTEQEKVGDYDYRFPVMQISGYHLWRVEERVVTYDDPFFYPCIGIYCRHLYYDYGPREGKVIKTVK
ncbi:MULTISPECIES: Slp family lipoprotein [Vibrio]|nr:MULTISPECIES: Slp family lipoprotein [Vibrio]NAX19875.1 Slp family lipoprotein [Vibrio sp. V39_P1S14PM300]